LARFLHNNKWKVVESFEWHLPLQGKLARSTLKTEESKGNDKNKVINLAE